LYETYGISNFSVVISVQPKTSLMPLLHLSPQVGSGEILVFRQVRLIPPPALTAWLIAQMALNRSLGKD